MKQAYPNLCVRGVSTNKEYVRGLSTNKEYVHGVVQCSE